MGAKSSRQQEQMTQCSINDLADKDLANIFKHLPLDERLLVSQVSKRWYEISRIPWRDVDHLDLSTISGENIGPIVKLCPNLRTVFAKDKQFALNQLKVLSSRANLSSLTVYKSSAAVPEPSDNDESVAVFSAVFSERLPSAAWKEMVLSDFNVVLRCDNYKKYITGYLPVSLERLQLTCFDLKVSQGDSIAASSDDVLVLDGIVHLHHLTCLILCPSPANLDEFEASEWRMDIIHELRALTQLRELCISSNGIGLDFETLGVDLPRLEVLFVNSVFFNPDESGLENVATKHPVLRVLSITGTFLAECTVPVRRRLPNGFGSDPVPKLHVFVGKKPSEKIIFTKSPADVLQIHPITDPLPAFLEKAEIAPLFEGVWTAAQIKEGAKHGSNWWKYEGDTATSFRTADDA